MKAVFKAWHLKIKTKYRWHLLLFQYAFESLCHIFCCLLWHDQDSYTFVTVTLLWHDQDSYTALFWCLQICISNIGLFLWLIICFYRVCQKYIPDNAKTLVATSQIHFLRIFLLIIIQQTMLILALALFGFRRSILCIWKMELLSQLP